MIVWEIIGYFVFLFPLYMSIVWIVGGLIFYMRWERKAAPLLDAYPPFTIIVPAHNEEANIEQTIENLKDLEYPNYEVIVANDGSTDNTASILGNLVKKYSDWLKVINISPNGGKAKATNAALLLTKGHFILVIDADSILGKDALKYMAWHFVSHPRLGAVTGNPRVLNRTTLLGKIQVGEYSSIIGLIKRAQRILGKMLSVSGVIAAYRKSALFQCGLFSADTVTEDIDMTWKLQKNFWDVRYEPRALCWVLVPETIKGLFMQRVRWAQGGIEVLKKHSNIWRDKRQRRLWPVYVEYVVGTLWAYSLAIYIVFWLVSYVLFWFFDFGTDIVNTAFPLLPKKTGSILALVCLIQFIVSISIDSRYEEKSSLKYYFWAVWYPFAYWVISAVASIVGVFNIFIRKTGRVTVTWQSPDRGLHTLK
ncbi:MAG: poly-beta-1,6-N-acetyl-D-glucosamine synthase [Pseudomonadota bacterium]